MNKKEIYISVLLKDNMIVSFRISGNEKKYPHDFYKDFYYADKSMGINVDEIYKVKSIKIELDDDISSEFNNYIFEEFARNYFRHWKIHPEHFGKAAY